MDVFVYFTWHFYFSFITELNKFDLGSYKDFETDVRTMMSF